MVLHMISGAIPTFDRYQAQIILNWHCQLVLMLLSNIVKVEVGNWVVIPIKKPQEKIPCPI